MMIILSAPLVPLGVMSHPAKSFQYEDQPRAHTLTTEVMALLMLSSDSCSC